MASFFVEQPLVKDLGAEILRWTECMLAVLLFFSAADTAVSLIRKPGNRFGTRTVRILGFAAFLVVLVLGLINGTESESFNNGVYVIQEAFGSALAGIVCLSMIFALYRLPGQSPTVMKSAFFIGLILFLAVYSGVPQMLGLAGRLEPVIEWLKCVPRGCLTGLLIGIALGGAVAAVRFILSGRVSAKEGK